MSAPFREITICLPLPVRTTNEASRRQIKMAAYLSDLYGRYLGNYKPPYCSRIIIRLSSSADKLRVQKAGSVISVDTPFDEAAYCVLDKVSKFRYFLDVIQVVVRHLAEQYNWKKEVFETAYEQVLEHSFVFRFSYPPVLSKDRKKKATITIEKNEDQTTVYATIAEGKKKLQVLLFEKPNHFWNDCAYVLTRYTKWLDAHRFAIDYPPGRIMIACSTASGLVEYSQDGVAVDRIDFTKAFWLQGDK